MRVMCVGVLRGFRASRALIMKMKVHELMHQAVRVPGQISVAAAARLMDSKRVDSVLVDHKGLLGIATEKDIMRKVVARGLDPSQVKVADVMSFPLHTIHLSTDVEEASEIMDKHDIRRLVIMENGSVVGVINAASIAKNVRYINARRLITHEMGGDIGMEDL